MFLRYYKKSPYGKNWLNSWPSSDDNIYEGINRQDDGGGVGLKRQFEGKEELIDTRTGKTHSVNVYFEYIPGRIGTYRAELLADQSVFATMGETYEEALERLHRRLLERAS